MHDLYVDHKAQSDLDQIYHYIAEDSPNAAFLVIESIRRTFDRLCTFPGIGRSRDEIRTSLRSICGLGNASSYIIYYVVRDNLVSILRVRHGAMNEDALTSDE